MYNFACFEDKRESVNNNSKHFEYCEKHHIPYVVVSSYNHKYDEIFYDITNLGHNLEEVSNKIKTLYTAYIQFLLIPYYEVQECFEQNYFFYFYTQKEHTDKIARQLFNYLMEQ